MAENLDDIALNVRRRRRTDSGGRRLANHPLTHAYLEAGMNLIQDVFFDQEVGDGGIRNPLSALTRDSVIVEAAKGGKICSCKPSEGSFRDRWEYFPDYLGDLVRYALRSGKWSPHLALTEAQVEALADPENRFSSAVHEIAYYDAAFEETSTAIRLQFLVSSISSQNASVREALEDFYEYSNDQWRKVFEATFSNRRLTLRPGLSLDELTIILAAVAEGLALRSSDSSRSQVIDHENRRSLLGKAATALVAGFMDGGDGLSIEELVDSLTN